MEAVLQFIDTNIFIYALFVLTAGTILAFLVYRNITRSEENQKKYLINIRKYQSVKTSSPIRNPVKTSKENSLENLGNQFTVIKSVLIPGIILITTLLVAVPFIGELPGNIISLLVATITLILGITIRPFLGNAISGIALSFSKLIRIGDTVKINGIYGVVYDISSTHTTIKIWDWRHYVLPNEVLLRSEFINYSIINKYLWVVVEFWMDYQSDIELTRRIAKEVPRRSSSFADYEEPKFFVMETAERSVKCIVAAWATSPADGWILSSDIRHELVKEFQKHQIRTHTYNTKSQAPDKPIADEPVKTP